MIQHVVYTIFVCNKPYKYNYEKHWDYVNLAYIILDIYLLDPDVVTLFY